MNNKEALLSCSETLKKAGLSSLAELFQNLSTGDIKIWIVEGTSGVYESYCDWPVAAYLTEENARKHAEKATARASEIHKNVSKIYKSLSSGRNWLDAIKASSDDGGNNEWDPGMRLDHLTGARYYHYSISVYASLSDALETMACYVAETQGHYRTRQGNGG
jgi:hypothetical protein